MKTFVSTFTDTGYEKITHPLADTSGYARLCSVAFQISGEYVGLCFAKYEATAVF